MTQILLTVHSLPVGLNCIYKQYLILDVQSEIHNTIVWLLCCFDYLAEVLYAWSEFVKVVISQA